jgi:hypothetical protein
MDLKNQYGFPDVVTFSNMDPFLRTTVWLNKGILATVGFPSDTSPDTTFDLEKIDVVRINYYSPMDLTQLEEAGFSDMSDKPSNGDVVDLFPKDPFNWGR